MNSISPSELLFALDIGTRSVIGTVGRISDKKFNIIGEKYIEHDERAMVDGQIHDINAVTKVVRKVKESLEEELNIPLNEVAIAAAGRFLNTVEVNVSQKQDGEIEIGREEIKALELNAVQKAEKQIGKGTNGKLYCVGYSVKNYYLNSYLISNLLGHKGEEIGVELIATFLPRSVIDSLYTVMNNVGLKVTNLTLEPIAAIEAVVPKKLRLLNIALVDIGAGTSDIAISANESIIAFGMVPMAGDEITEVIAQNLLVDFNEAERIKRELSDKEEVSYIDVIGLENSINKEELLKIIRKSVEKLAKTISSKLLSLNGDKPPSAIFLVGGGAYTPELHEYLSEEIGIPKQRIAIKDRNGVELLVGPKSFGAAGVTVLGIGIVAMSKSGEDFIEVSLNGKYVTLFNSHKHKVMDVLIQSGLDSKCLLAKRGKSLRIKINGNKRLFFGEMGNNPVISINGKKATLDSFVSKGDSIKFAQAKVGKDAKVTLGEIISNRNTISITIDNRIVNIEPIIYVNGKKESLDYILNEGDEVTDLLPITLESFKTYYKSYENKELYKNNILLPRDFIFNEGDVISSETFIIQSSDSEENLINVTFNGDDVVLYGKDKYLLLDIFNYIDLKISENDVKSKFYINGKSASYTEELKNGDKIEFN